LEERQQIFETHLKKISLHSEPSKYSEYLAYLTPGFSGNLFVIAVLSLQMLLEYKRFQVLT